MTSSRGVEGSSSASSSSLGLLSRAGDGDCVSVSDAMLTTSWLSTSAQGSHTKGGTA